MKMVTTIAYKNMKHYKSRNILTGIAILLTTLLLYLVPTIGLDMVGAQFAMVNEVYPRWHCLIRDVDRETATKLAAHHDVLTSGLRSDVGYWAGLDVDVSMMYMDENGLDLYQIKLEEGSLPRRENEIVVSRKLLQAAGLTGEIGDTIRFSYQPLSEDGLGYVKEGEFIISGFYQEQQEEPTAFSSFVSREFAEKHIPADQIKYRFLFQVGAEENVTTDDVEDIIKGITEQFGIDEEQVRVNDEYLAANYVDPTTIPVIAVIMLIIVIAGIITIYSIYYVGMADAAGKGGTHAVFEFLQQRPEHYGGDDAPADKRRANSTLSCVHLSAGGSRKPCHRILLVAQTHENGGEGVGNRCDAPAGRPVRQEKEQKGPQELWGIECSESIAHLPDRQQEKYGSHSCVHGHHGRFVHGDCDGALVRQSGREREQRY